MARIYIQDQTYEGSYGYSDFQFSILGASLKLFPPLKVGSVIRIHYMTMQLFSGALTGRVYDPRGVTVFPGSKSDPIDPICTTSRDLKFTAEDRAKVEELRDWYAQLYGQDITKVINTG